MLKKLQLAPKEFISTFADCPAGPFVYSVDGVDYLCFKSLENGADGYAKAYNADGSAFTGGTSSNGERQILKVQSLEIEWYNV